MEGDGVGGNGGAGEPAGGKGQTVPDVVPPPAQLLSLAAESEIKGDILFLGYYQSAFDWDDEMAKVWAPPTPGTPPSPRPTLLRESRESPGVPVPIPLFPSVPPGLQAAPAEAIPQPELRQWLPVRPHRPSQRG